MTKVLKLGNANVSLIGKFELTVRKDPKKFKLTNINSYIPKGKTMTERVNFKTESGEVESLMINKMKTIFKPDESEIDRHNVESLIKHPHVYIEGYPKLEWERLVRENLKSLKSEFILKNIDKELLEDYDNENELIEARAILRSTRNKISKQKLVWLCSFFGLPHRNQVTDPQRQRVFLISKLDKFIQDTGTLTQGRKNLELFIEAVNNIKHTEMVYYINEFKSFGLVVDFGGIYKVGDRPVGSGMTDLINWYSDHPEIFNGHKKQILESSQLNTTM